MRFIAVLLLFAGLAFAKSQETLYSDALDAEERGDLTEAISLFKQALDAGGEYDEELREILASYSSAVDDNAHLNFSADLFGKFFYYNEDADKFYAKETYGGLFFRTSAAYETKLGGYDVSLGASVAGDYFIKRDSTVLDTTKFYVSPLAEFCIQGETFLAMLSGGAEFGNGTNIALNGYVDKDFLKVDNSRFSVRASANYLEDERLKTLGAVAWNYHTDSRAWEHSLSFGAYLVVDSIYYMEKNLYYDTVWVSDSEDSYESGSSIGNAFGYGKENNIDKGNENQFDVFYNGVEDIVTYEYYDYFGKRSKLLGPRLMFRGSYKFNDDWKLHTFSNAYLGFAVDESRTVLDLDAALRLTRKLGLFSIYSGVAVNYRHYVTLPSKYIWTVANDRLLLEVELGTRVDF